VRFDASDEDSLEGFHEFIQPSGVCRSHGASVAIR
jgi:hypothetical protein